MSKSILIRARVDGWTIENCGGALVARNENRTGFVAFNYDMSALYVADVAEVPFSVIDALRKQVRGHVSESKEPGQRVYEAYHGVHDFSWRTLKVAERRRWAAAESASTPEPSAAESTAACRALVDALGLPADHPQRNSVAWLAGVAAGRLSGLREPAAADRAAWAMKVLDAWSDSLGRRWFTKLCPLGDGTYDTYLQDDSVACNVLHTNGTRDGSRIAAAEALASASPDRYPDRPAEAAPNDNPEVCYPHSPKAHVAPGHMFIKNRPCEWCGRSITETRDEPVFPAEEVAAHDAPALERRIVELEGRRREGRQLLRRAVKYLTEGSSGAGGKLGRFAEQVDDYLIRTHDPRDILRAPVDSGSGFSESPRLTGHDKEARPGSEGDEASRADCVKTGEGAGATAASSVRVDAGATRGSGVSDGAGAEVAAPPGEQWIPVEREEHEHLAQGTAVLAHHPDWGVHEGWVNSAGSVSGNWPGGDMATHWRPLPAPPKGTP